MTACATFAELPAVELVVKRLRAGVHSILADQLVGVYLYGSLITGDFDPAVSDVDLVAVMSRELDDRSFSALHRLHCAVAAEFPACDNRLELAYITAAALRTFRTRSSTIGIISPGEPFHRISAGRDWLISWYALRQDGVALMGPPITTLIEPIPKAAWLIAVGEHVCHFRESVKKPHNKSALAYIVLTVARGLYTLEYGEPISKIRAASWAAARHPRWAALLEQALRWRLDPNSDSLSADEVRPRVRIYLMDMLSRMDCD